MRCFSKQNRTSVTFIQLSEQIGFSPLTKDTRTGFFPLPFFFFFKQ